jgi:hypothetical protein
MPIRLRRRLPPGRWAARTRRRRFNRARKAEGVPGGPAGAPRQHRGPSARVCEVRLHSERKAGELLRSRQGARAANDI